MATAGNLRDAAYYSGGQCGIQALASNLRVAILGFINQAATSFSDAVPNDRPVGNWLILIQSELATLPANGTGTAADIARATAVLYRICFAGDQAFSDNLITTAQRNALLAAWNDNLGT